MFRVALIAAITCAATPAFSDRIIGAAYHGPTDRYPHGVLGDPIEYTKLQITLDDGVPLVFELDSKLVFEDISPRLIDLDGDHNPEIITTESHQNKGARVSVFKVVDRSIQRIATTPFIGTKFRWLGIIGSADLNGDGLIEIAYIDRPHLAKVLRVVAFDGTQRLTEIAAQDGLSNHRIGDAYISGGVRDCTKGPEMITANANWTKIIATAFVDGQLRSQEIGDYKGRASIEAQLSC